MVATRPSPRRWRRQTRLGFVEKSLAGITANIEGAIFSEENARSDGFLQRRDPRAKLLSFVVLVVATGLSRDWRILVGLYALLLATAFVSALELWPFVRRVWLGIPLFSAIVVVPSIFFVGRGGTSLLSIPFGLFELTVYKEAVLAALVFVLRVGVSVSFAILLVMTTPWAGIMKSLRAFRVPNVFVLVLSIAYRYIFLFLHTASGMFLARKSRIVARTSGKEQRWWVVASIGVLMQRSFRMSDEVYLAMVTRGFRNEMKSIHNFRFGPVDAALLATSCAVAAASVYGGGRL